MKNYIKNLLKASLVMLAVVAAFAFTTPQSSIQGQLFANDGGDWVPIPDVPPGTLYECDGEEAICTAKFLDDDPSDMENIIPDSVRPGQYVDL